MKKISMIGAAVTFLSIAMYCNAEVSPDTRLLQRPELDGAIVSRPWLSGELRYQDWKNNKGFLIGPTYVMPWLDNKLETGARVSFLSMDPDGASSKSGLTDIDLWGKYQFLNNGQVLLNGGLLITLPTGEKKTLHPKATGKVNFELFSGMRYNVNDRCAAVGHLGVRVNGGQTVYGIKYDGKTQLEFGGGAIYQAKPKVNLLGELNIATKPYDPGKTVADLTFGTEYLYSQKVKFRGGIAVGLSDGSPDFELIVGSDYGF